MAKTLTSGGSSEGSPACEGQLAGTSVDGLQGDARLTTLAHRAAVKQLFCEHNRALVNFLRARMSSEQEARDVAQEAYVRLLQLDRPGAVGFLRGYLFRIAANLSVDRTRNRVVRERLEIELFEELSDEGLNEHKVITRLEFDRACEALNELPLKQRQAFLQHVIEGHTTPEVSRQMGVDERTVRKYVTRALLHCRRRLEGE